MMKAIEENWWEKRLPAMKQKILNEMNMFPRLENIIRSKGGVSVRPTSLHPATEKKALLEVLE